MSSTTGFRWRGVIEGFYGPPWTRAQRLDMLAFMGRHGYNVFFYAPKDDPLHRARWREFYSREEMARFAEMAKTASTHGLQIAYGIGPGLSLRYSDPAEVDTLIERYEQLATVGLRMFGLFFDDIPEKLQAPEDQERFESLASAQSHVINAVYQRLQDRYGDELTFFICPTQYHGDEGTPYVRQLGQSLDPAIEVFWTGRSICSEAITSAEAQRLGEVLRRPPLYWDNYPVNDVAMCAELHIGAYEHRDADLYRYSSGVVSNPMSFPEASKIGIACIGAYASNPERYDAKEAWRSALSEVAGSSVQDAMEMLAEQCTYSCLHRADPEALTRLAGDVWQLIEGPEPVIRQRWRDLTAYLLRMKQAAASLQVGCENDALMSEIRPWIVEMEHWAETGLQAVKAMRTARLLWGPELDEQGNRVDDLVEAELERLGALLRDTVGFRTRVTGNVLRSLSGEVLVRVRAIQFEAKRLREGERNPLL